MKQQYYYKNKEFVIENYNNQRAFSSFLPGIAGLHGKPLWAFFMNRAQGMSSFGIRDKDGAIMEFYPANIACRRISLEGFRTFIKIDNKRGKKNIYEPFRIYSRNAKNRPEQRFYVSPHEFRIEEISRKHSLKIEVIYNTIPNEDFPALSRILRIENLNGQRRDIELIDGMPKICHFGMNEFFMKHMSRTIEAWMEAEWVSPKAPLYKLSVSASDVSTVKYITSGNFYLSVTDKGTRPNVIIDPECVFGDYADFTYPGAFRDGISGDLKKQKNRNITMSAFSHCALSLPGKSMRSLYSLIGYAESNAALKKIEKKIKKSFFANKRIENKIELEKISSSVTVFSNELIFDEYVKQTNLDNILRGGYPVTIENSGKVMYVFNRKHGDLERDYNNFILRPEFYSQGNGNFRDTLQNRRNSLWINPKVEQKDIIDFYNLIQLDGFNPLVIKGDTLTLKTSKRAKAIARKYFNDAKRKKAEEFLLSEFTFADLIHFNLTKLTGTTQKDFLKNVLSQVSSKVSAQHHEGYWIDHWTYTLDLIDAYLGLYPEKRYELLFKEKKYMFFDSPYRVKPRNRRYIKKGADSIRQYKSVYLDKDKKDFMDLRKSDKTWVRSKKGKGHVYKCTLAVKIMAIIANKMASLDAEGRGIEMEADKPDWCDSLNGLPGIMGSSISVTAELLRLVVFFKKAAEDLMGDVTLSIPVEILNFCENLTKELKRNLEGEPLISNYEYWDKTNSLKETFREDVRYGLDGREEALDKEDLMFFLALSLKKLKNAILKSIGPNEIPFTYFINEATVFDKNCNVKEFKSRPMPFYLEGPTRVLKTEEDRGRILNIYKNIRKSSLYDKELRMYKLNASIEKESLEIGRSRVFTPGWLENESIWLHMEYKYLLEVLRKGLYDEFYDDFRKVLVAFQAPERYGRSVLENSSFIVSSRFFDKNMHGLGFIARLTGATAEFMHMLRIMNLGEVPFTLLNGKLAFKPEPILHKELFTKKSRKIEFCFKRGRKSFHLPTDSYAFSVFENTLIICKNPKKKNTFGKNAVRPIQFTVHEKSGKHTVLEGPYLKEPFASALRERKIESISILLG